MARLKPDAITAEDLSKYLSDETADFAFELRTVHLLRALGLSCDHGGLYEDPVTKKARQFDIRAIARDDGCCVRLAIECKNLRANFPLLVCCVPRHPDESFHEVAIVGEIENGQQHYGLYANRAHTLRLCQPNSLYRLGEPVGKSLAQVGRDAQKGAITSSDEEVFDRWGQCLASAHELVIRSTWEGAYDSPSIFYVAVLPIVVVPDNLLWMAQYDARGEFVSGPVQTNQCSFFVNQVYDMDVGEPSLHISHIEFVTLSGLETFVRDSLKSRTAMENIFPRGSLETELENLRAGH